MIMYSPKISDDLVMTIYKIGKYEGIPMTRVVDRLLRDSVRDYINSLDDDEIADTVFYRNGRSNGNPPEHRGGNGRKNPDDRRRGS